MVDLSEYGIQVAQVQHNLVPARLYELAVAQEGASLCASGALATRSGAKTGRSPQDKRVVEHPSSAASIWWGPVNIPMAAEGHRLGRERAVDYLNSRPYLYVVDGFAGWDPRYRLKVRVICGLAYHALFMRNMLIRPTDREIQEFGRPELVIFNAGQCPADPQAPGTGTTTMISIDSDRRELVILGTLYAGEMKKGIFSVMNHWMPQRGILSMHCSANEGPAGDVSIFFGLSGTGKTTLSADPRRRLIGDDEHCWSDQGIFNIEGGCYAKCIHLSPEREPEIYQSIRFGTVLENVVLDAGTREVDFSDASITENTRAAYPIEFIPNAKVPCVGSHPRNVLFLACDAFGVLPPVSRLTAEQAMYHFLSGYTAKVAGTEMGVREPQATFSTCFGAPFLMCQPSTYARMLADRLREHAARAWLVNTGWSGGACGQGARMPLAYTRAIIDAIHAGALENVPAWTDPVFGLEVPTVCPDVPSKILVPHQTWSDRSAFDEAARQLAALFRQNFVQYAEMAGPQVAGAGPRVPQ